MSEFRPATLEELKKIIANTGIKSAPQDPLPASLIAENVDLLLPYWQDIVNLSLETGSMNNMKDAIIFPLIKDLSPLIDRDEFKNYRPVSNLTFISKLIERVVDSRLEEHMSCHNLHSANQYGYKKQHSTELLLVNVCNKLLLNCDCGIPWFFFLISVQHSTRSTILNC